MKEREKDTHRQTFRQVVVPEGDEDCCHSDAVEQTSIRDSGYRVL